MAIEANEIEDYKDVALYVAQENEILLTKVCAKLDLVYLKLDGGAKRMSKIEENITKAKTNIRWLIWGLRLIIVSEIGITGALAISI